MKKRKIVVTTGTRAEYGILRLLLFEIIKSKKLQLFLIVTGTHLSKKHGYTINEIKKDKIIVEPLKSRFRLDWIFTKIRIGKFYPFPLIAILLIGIPLIPMVLLSIGVELPFSIVELPGVKPVVNYMGIFSDKDLFVTSTWVFWWPIFIFTILIFSVKKK